MSAPRLYDISPRIGPGADVWPGDAPYEQQWTWSLGRGDSVNVAHLHLSPHTGAHADAPLHVVADGADSASQALEPFWGPVRVVAREGRDRLTLEEVTGLDWRGVTRVLFRTRRPDQAMRFDETLAHFTGEAAHFLARQGLRLVGIDTPSVDGFTSKELPAHHAFFAGGVSILEGLELGEVPDGDYELAALPLRLAGADASPVRAVLRELRTP